MKFFFFFLNKIFENLFENCSMQTTQFLSVFIQKLFWVVFCLLFLEKNLVLFWFAAEFGDLNLKWLPWLDVSCNSFCYENQPPPPSHRKKKRSRPIGVLLLLSKIEKKENNQNDDGLWRGRGHRNGAAAYYLLYSRPDTYSFYILFALGKWK